MIEALLAFYEAHQTTLGIIAILSLLMFIASILSLPLLVSLIPADYFQYDHPYRLYHRFRHSAIRLLIITVKNLLGWLLIVIGILMLFLPGQGVLTIIMGLVMVDFPGKRRLECKLVSRPKLLRAINWLRAKRNKEPLLVPQKKTA